MDDYELFSSFFGPIFPREGPADGPMAEDSPAEDGAVERPAVAERTDNLLLRTRVG